MSDKLLDKQYPLPGIEVWKNKKNGFCVFEIHYTADPAKRDPEFIAKVRRSMPRRKYLQEYEKAWESWTGLPVYADFDKSIHGVEGEIRPHVGLPLLRGWDWGLTPACVVAQLQGETLAVMYEFTAVNMGAERFSTLVLRECQVLYKFWGDQKKDWIDYVDPSGAARKDTDEGSCTKILDAKGLEPIGGAIAFEERRSSVEHFLTRRTSAGPGFKISLPNCRKLVQGFEGGYRYPDSALEINNAQLRPIKNEYSHCHDALQMVTSRLRVTKRRTGIKVPVLSYSWNSNQVNHGYAGK